MASLPDGITLDIPDLRVTITPRSDYIVKIQPVDEYHVVTFDTPTITRATSVFVDYAQSASYANSAGSAVSASYADTAGASDWDTLTNKPTGLVSSSTQTIANINGQEITPSIISSSGHIVPSTTEIYDLGSTDLRWRDLYLSGSTIYLGDAKISSTDGIITVTDENDNLLPQSGSFTGSFTGSFVGDGSLLTNVPSSGTITTAQTASSVAHLQQIVAVTGSINVTGSGIITEDMILRKEDQQVLFRSIITRNVYSETRQIQPTIPTGSYSGCQIEYHATKASATRQGVVLGTWLNGEISYTDVSNLGIGNSDDLSFNMIISSDQAIIRAVSSGTDSQPWQIHTFLKTFSNIV